MKKEQEDREEKRSRDGGVEGGGGQFIYKLQRVIYLHRFCCPSSRPNRGVSV